MLAKLRQAILYRLMILEYKMDAKRLTAKEREKKWPIVQSQAARPGSTAQNSQEYRSL